MGDITPAHSHNTSKYYIEPKPKEKLKITNSILPKRELPPLPNFIISNGTTFDFLQYQVPKNNTVLPLTLIMT